MYHPVRALERIREVLRALAHVHARGLVHLDVKPANLLRFGDTIKVTDFGTSRTLTTLQHGCGDDVVGSHLYAAPEQLEGEGVDERADLYGVGCMLHEMLTGSVPEPSAGVGNV